MASSADPASGALRGRTALVTGASRGIGEATARALAAAGARVAVVARSGDPLRALAREIDAVAVPADLASAEAVEEMAAAVRSAFGGAPELVVNSAGAFDLAPLAELGVESFDRQIAVNLRAPFLVIRAFLAELLQRRSGHLVTVGSVAGRIALPGNAAYGASKFGLRGLHEVLALEVQGSGVRATLIEPAATDTPLWDPLDPDHSPDLPDRAQMLRAEDVARAIVWVASQPPGVDVPHLAIRAVS